MKFYTYSCRLCNVQRFLGKTLNSPYSVGDHSFRVAQLCTVIGKELEAAGYTIFWDRLLIRALNHDLPEAVVGDVPKPYKYECFTPEVLKEAELSALTKIIKAPEYIVKEFEAHYDTSIESIIVKIADVLELLITMCFEIQEGNSHFRDSSLPECIEFLRNVDGDIQLSAPSIGALISKALTDINYGGNNEQKKN